MTLERFLWAPLLFLQIPIIVQEGVNVLLFSGSIRYSILLYFLSQS